MNWNLNTNHWLLLGIIFFGYIVLTWIAGIGPALWVQDHTQPLPGAKPMTALQRKGLEVYIAEGCAACHTQQVRPIKMDRVWGRPSVPGDYAFVDALNVLHPYAPAVLGSERTGPDLTDIGARQASKVWQYIHLYQPRAVSPDSIMPAFPWLFKVVDDPAPDAVVVPVPKPYAPDEGKVVAKTRAKALVAYLLSLKQTPITIPGFKSGAAASSGAAAPTSASSEPETSQSGAGGANGEGLYASHCATCHQANGQGLPGVFPPLVGDPVVTAGDPTRHIETVLHGAHGRNIGGTTYPAPMPAFSDVLGDAGIAAIINHERTSWGNHAPTVTAADVAKIRGGKQ